MKDRKPLSLIPHFQSGNYSISVYLLVLFVFTYLIREYVVTRYHHLVPSLIKYLIPAGFGFLLTVVLIPLCIRLAFKFKIVNRPEGPKAHLPPIPMLGGLGIFLAFLIVASLYQPWTVQMQAIIIGAAIIAALGTLDDIFKLSSVTRLIGQLAASGIVIASGLKVSFMPDVWWGELGAVLITIVWILGIVNATNFIDGADGLAAGYTVIASIFFFLITLHLGQIGVVLISSLMIGTGLGFLVFNFKPAKIYLGDGGSTFMGFVLACLALYGGWSSWGPIIAIGIPTLILGILIFDMIYITVSRIRNGHVRNVQQWLDYRGRDHFHHRLMNLGLKEEDAVLFIYSTSIILGLSALVIEHARFSFPVVVLMIQATLIFINITILMLTGRQVYPDAPKK